jgi:hypothetical protein
MGKYGEQYQQEDDLKPTDDGRILEFWLWKIAEELAEANRLKRIELRQGTSRIQLRSNDYPIQDVIDKEELEDKA